MIILICNERHLNDEASQLLRRLAAQAELILLPVSDPLEHCLPNIGQAQFALATSSVSIDTRNPNLRQQWHSKGAAYQAAWQSLAQQLGAPLLPLSTEFGALQQLQAINLQQLHSPQVGL